MGKRGPVIFGMLLSLSFFSGLLTLMLLSGTTSPIPPASELPRLLPPEAEAPDVVGSPRATSPLQIPFPVLDDGVVVPGTVAFGGPVAGTPGGGTGTSPEPGDGSAPGPVVIQPPGVLPREDPDEDPDTDRHSRTRGKGHDKGHGKGHDHGEDGSGRTVTSHDDDGSSGKSGKSGKGGKTKPAGRGKASKRLAKR